MTVKQELGGFFSRYMHDDLNVGDRVDMRSPFGRFTFAGSEAYKVVLIAGGVGVTPFPSIIRHLAAIAWKGELSLLYSMRTTKDAIRGEELRRLADQHPNFRVHLLYSLEGPEGSNVVPARITASLLHSLVPDVARRRAYICGPVPMMEALAGMLEDCGVPPAAIFIESFGEALASPKPKELSAAA